MMLADIAKTFDNLRKINMKLNQNKCSFGVEDGKFLGYMVTSKGIRANPKKTKILADLHSPRTLKEIQILTEKLAALNRKRKQCPIHYVSLTLKEAERNYAPMENLALSLVYITRKLRRYFKAYPVKVITDQPIKQILNKTEVAGKLEKYAVELGAYNVTFIPRNAVKGQGLADFITETPDEESPEWYFWTQEVTPERGDTKVWTLFTDEASSVKGSDAGLVLIGPSGVEHTYALCLTCDNTNNEVEYKALLASLRLQNVLSKLASIDFNHLTKEVLVKVLNELSTEAKDINTVVDEEGDNWMTPIIQCLEKGVWPKDKNEARSLQVKINQYAIEDGVLFKKSYLVPMLRCVGPLQANYVSREIHMGSCDMHSGPRVIVRKAIWQGYYWPTMHEDAKKEIQKFGLPRIIITDNATQFINDPFNSWCARLNIQQMNTAIAYPQANGLVERENKSLIEGIKTRLGREKDDWVDELPNVL
uniref:Integrase catalytic domain-containing protein n=1 Tax=Tanacetum cinerariifolium TaxID=118510 RepID=A0A6L2JY07_TANCI|nr:hypothetical protein [Tanacetum cinerariifolium]